MILRNGIPRFDPFRCVQPYIRWVVHLTIGGRDTDITLTTGFFKSEICQAFVHALLRKYGFQSVLIEEKPFLERMAEKLPRELVDLVFHHGILPGKLFPRQRANEYGYYYYGPDYYNRPLLSVLRLNKAYYNRYQEAFRRDNRIVVAFGDHIDTMPWELRMSQSPVFYNYELAFSLNDWTMSMQRRHCPHGDYGYDESCECQFSTELLTDAHDANKQLLSTWDIKFTLLIYVKAKNVILDFRDCYAFEQDGSAGRFLGIEVATSLEAFVEFPEDLQIWAPDSKMAEDIKEILHHRWLLSRRG